jgi:LIVCS family branched-chain amino acid:cation transporter
MKTSFYSTIWLAGIAIFSMFFGAGNVIFPLKVGLIAGEQIPYALLGLLITAIGGPILGLVGATLYKGNCLTFFCRPGRTIGITFILICLFLLGPFAVIPRCFVVAHSSMSELLGGMNLFTFSLIFGILSLACCIKESYMLPILGKFFSPILLLSLLSIISIGITSGSSISDTGISTGSAFLRGLEEGFDTMDLIAAIFFSSSIWGLLIIKMKDDNERHVAKTAIFAGLIGGTLLGLVYIGLGLATAFHATELTNTPPEKLMSSLAMITLGPIWGHLANIAIAIACFTTAVSLTQTIAALCSRDFFPKTLRYRDCLIGITIISIAISDLGFSIISALIHPAISICYPAIIVLTIFNLIHKIYGVNTIRRPVYGTLVSSTVLKSLYLIGTI